MAELSRDRSIDLRAAHLDHAIDAGSEERADTAVGLCRQLGVPVFLERLDPGNLGRAAGGLEAAARRVRYERLEIIRRRVRARYIASGHQADDQIETLLLRLLQGSGLSGLAGMSPLQGRLARPLLSLRRATLVEVLAAARLQAVEDPDNLNLLRKRNLVRWRLIPHLAQAVPDIGDRLLRIADEAGRCRVKTEAILSSRLRLREVPDGAVLDLSRLRRLPPPLWPQALAALQRLAGAAYPAGRAALRELVRQIESGRGVGCDCGGGWRWESRGECRLSLVLARKVGRFAYTLEVPGEVEIPESGSRLSLRPATDGLPDIGDSPERVVVRLPREGRRLVVRNRRPGDRIQPLGCSYSRRLKDVLTDHQVPRDVRDRLPLLCLGGQVVWAPGVAFDERFRGESREGAWIAELRRL